jgi:hypothetical protein
MQSTALALALLAVFSLLGLLGPAFQPNAQGLFIMLGGLVLFVIFSGLAALLYFTAEPDR